MNEHKKYGIRARIAYRILILICALALILAIAAFYFLGDEFSFPSLDGSSTPEYQKLPPTAGDHEEAANLEKGLIRDEGMQAVLTHCTPCHSAEFITQNRMDREGWIATIRWMQETQNLWPLGDSEEEIVNYLVRNYPPQKKGRREPLSGIEWYELKQPDQ